MAKKSTALRIDGSQERFWCQHCKKSAATDKSHLQCDTCGDAMVRMKEHVRRMAKGAK